VSWDTNGIRGLKRFSDKLWQFDKFLDVEPESITRSLHKTIKKVTEDIESMRFNTAVSALMIFVNELSDVGCTRETFKALLTLLFPVMPHLAEELAERNGGHDSLFLADWPKFDASLVIDDVVEMAVQVNGKVRDKIIVNINATEAEAKELALNSEKVSKFLDGREVKKVIFVKGKLISLVV
jgi:leucyl-tRNA synthetase